MVYFILNFVVTFKSCGISQMSQSQPIYFDIAHRGYLLH